MRMLNRNPKWLSAEVFPRQPKLRREWQYNAAKHKGKASASRVINIKLVPLKPSSYRHQRDTPKSQNCHDVFIDQAFRDNCQLIDTCVMSMLRLKLTSFMQQDNVLC